MAPDNEFHRAFAKEKYSTRDFVLAVVHQLCAELNDVAACEVEDQDPKRKIGEDPCRSPENISQKRGA